MSEPLLGLNLWLRVELKQMQTIVQDQRKKVLSLAKNLSLKSFYEMVRMPIFSLISERSSDAWGLTLLAPAIKISSISEGESNKLKYFSLIGMII